MSMNQAQTIAELKLLLDGVSEHGRAHLDEIQADLAQTRLLLAEAIGRLGACFAEMREAMARPRALLQEPRAGADADALERAAVLASFATIEAKSQAMITALQFEDMTSQLIAHSERRIAGLREMLAILGAGAQSLGDGGDGGDDAQLAAMHGSFAARSRELADVLSRKVGQRHLDSGDMELF
jgi:hypothetical protein